MENSLSKAEKRQLVLQLSKELGQSIKKCTEILENNNWVLPSLNSSAPSSKSSKSSKSSESKKAPSTKKASTRVQKSKKKKPSKSSKLIEQDEEGVDTGAKTEEIYENWHYYLKREKQQQKKKIDNVECPSMIGKGFYTMKEIVAYANLNIKNYETAEQRTLKSFNKHHKSKYKTWVEASTDKNLNLTESDLVEYKDYIEWYTYVQNHSLPKISKKNFKILKDKINSASFFAGKSVEN